LAPDGHGENQLDIGAIDLLPNAPTTYQLRDWRDVALKFDNLVFDVNATGQFLPLTRIDMTPQYPLLQESFGIAAYVGETRTYSENGEPVFESLSTLGAVLGGSLVGIDKSSGPHNWVSMTREFSGDMRGLPLILNGPFDGTGGSAWYETIPSILFYSIADLYPNQTELAPVLDVVDDTFYDAVNVLTVGGTAPNFNYTAYNFATHQPEVRGHLEPDMGLGMAWLQHAAYWRNRVSNPTQAAAHLDAVDWSLAYYEQTSTNPDYEILTPFGAYTAARMNAEHGRNYDIQKLVNWVFDRSDARPTKIMISGEQWGGEDVGGLMGFTVPNTGADVRGYAFSMNTFETAMPMVPLARYEDRYSRAIGKWMVNVASAARLLYGNAHPPENQSSEFWTGDPDSSVAYEGLRHHWYSPFDGQELFAGGDALPSAWTSGYGPLTDFALYGGAYVGVFGSIIKPTNVEKILQLDLLATDFYHDAAYPTYLYYNPLDTSESIQIDLGVGQFDLYDAVSNRFLSRNLTGQVAFSIDSDKAVQLVLVPAGGVATTDRRRLLVDGVVIDYNATLLPGNLIRNPYVDASSPGNSSRPANWHYSSSAGWSADESLSPSHSLELEDANPGRSEEWRSYATEIPAGAQRELQVRWFWNYDIVTGEEFQGRLRLSSDVVSGLDLTSPSLEFNFLVSGTSSGFEMFETVIAIPDQLRSFDLTFITGGAFSALGTMFIDDISVALAPSSIPADFDGNGFVDGLDLQIWQTAYGLTAAGDADGDGDSDGQDFLEWQRQFQATASIATAVPEPGSLVGALFMLTTILLAGRCRRQLISSASLI
jgi:hypothetical protein